MRKLNSKPLNINSDGCDEKSSNCITWQGPSIPCLNICKGASLTQVMYDIAIKFCELYQQLSPANYNYECLDLKLCEEATFPDLFQGLLTTVCELKASEPFGGCNVLAQISQTSANTFTVTTAGATAPVSYSWTIPQVDYVGAAIPGASDGNSVTIAFTGDQLQAGTPPELKVNQALLKVTVVDKNGCVATDFILINRAI